MDRFFIQFWNFGWNRMRWRVMTPALQSPGLHRRTYLFSNFTPFIQINYYESLELNIYNHFVVFQV